MGIKERRQRQKETLRSGILAAAREIASTEGWRAVTIRKIAARVEYSPPGIYEDFGAQAPRARRRQPARYLRGLRLEGGPASRTRQNGLRRSARGHREGSERLGRSRRGPARDVERLVPLRLRSPRPLPGHVRPRGGLVPRSRAGEGGGGRARGASPTGR